MPAVRINRRKQLPPIPRLWPAVHFAAVLWLTAHGLHAQPATAEKPAGTPDPSGPATASSEASPSASIPAVVPWEYAPYRMRVWGARCASVPLAA